MNNKTNLQIAILLIVLFTLSTYILTKKMTEEKTHKDTISQMREGIRQCNIYCINKMGFSYKGFIEGLDENEIAECWCIHNVESTRGNQTEFSTENN